MPLHLSGFQTHCGWVYDARMPKSESTEQIQFITRARVYYPHITLFAVPNGGYRTPTQAARLKAEGVLAGVPDIFVAHPKGSYAGLFIEMKRAGRKGRVSLEQKRVMARLADAGYMCAVAYGVDEAWQTLQGYVDG